MSKQLIVTDDVHASLKVEASRRGIHLERLTDMVIRTGLKVKRIEVSEGEG